VKPRLLDLFCGAGGAARGYQQAGFYVVGVDINPQPHYCGDEFIQADAMTFDLDGYDAIHASPLCQGYTELNFQGKERYPKLIPQIKKRLKASGKPFVIENVMGAVSSLPGSITLCGTMFGLKVERHRLFESNMLLFAPGPCRHKKGCISVHGYSIWDSSQRGTVRKDGRVRPAIVPLEVAYEAMGIAWMTRAELVKAIPPAYTFHLAPFLLAAIEAEEVAVS
jgi:hypothetical protein